MQCEVTTVIDRPISVVWDFYAVHHVENHPRWDPDIELEKTTDGPVDVGSVIRRRSTRFETPTEGTMEVTEFEPEQTMKVTTQDGPMTINGWARFATPSEGQTQLTIGGEFPGMDDSMEETIRPLMDRSAANIKSLIESET
ncbi:MAG: SRPBCC family protein [Actinomycetota bacterium]|nr:SRPBCC family protein [Actinomycetota bacterium]